MAGAGVVVDAIGPDDWARWRTVRLRALATDPQAFASDLAREEALDEADWRPLLVGGPRVVARVAGADVGLAGAHLGDGPDEPQLFGMWVDPGHRGQGVGAVLVDAVVDALVAAGHDHVRLWVVSDNGAAMRLYARQGFVEEVDPPPGPGGCETAMVRPLASS